MLHVSVLNTYLKHVSTVCEYERDNTEIGFITTRNITQGSEGFNTLHATGQYISQFMIHAQREQPIYRPIRITSCVQIRAYCYTYAHCTITCVQNNSTLFRAYGRAQYLALRAISLCDQPTRASTRTPPETSARCIYLQVTFSNADA